jgi:hypothetical protein
VLLYELNEVPWPIIDHYLTHRPGSVLASALERAQCLTSINDDSAMLSPWRAWPTFHTGLYTKDHNSWALGQDSETFRGETIWDIAESSGQRVGLFGVPQSWPPREFSHGGFCVPDTFARDAQTTPASMSRFQQFNLAMTADNAFSSNAPLNTGQMVRVGVDIARKGLTLRSAGRLVQQLARERRDARWKAARPMAQALPAFDLFWRMHTRVRPNLSVFFTNHLAGVMHRYWGDTIPSYLEEFEYSPDEVFARFLVQSMDIFDGHLRRMLRWIERNPSTVLVVASGMGQEPIEYVDVSSCYLLREPARLTSTLGLHANEPGEAMMYPEYVLLFATTEGAEHAVEQLERVQLGLRPFFEQVTANGRTVTAKVTSYEGEEPVSLRASGDEEPTALTLEDVGVKIEERLGGGNTAYHCPHGIWIALGQDVEPDSSRAAFSVLDAKARVLDLLGLPEPAA